MLKSVELPVEIPVFATTQGSAAAGLAMINHPTAYNQTLNQATDLCCNRKFITGFTAFQLYVPNVWIHSYNFMERYTVSFRNIKKYCIDIIKEMLDEGFYVYYVQVDDFYLPGKSWYGTRHINHDGIICGYDDNDKSISIAAYDINWVFRVIRMPQESFMQGLEAAFEKNSYGNMTAYRICENTVVHINESEMLKYLKEYMDSNLEKYPVNGEGDVKGIAVHGYLAMYIDKLRDGSIPSDKMDWRAVRPVWEHKKCMLDRIKAVENKNGWNNELSERYAPVVEKAERIRMMYAMYHKNRNDKLLDKIYCGILELAESDKELVGEFIKRLEELVK